MAWLIKEGETWKVGFRWQGKLHKRSLKVEDQSKAEDLKKRIEINLAELELGRMELPTGADILTFLLTDGRKTAPPPAKVLTVKALFEAHHADMPPGSKEANTLATEKTHMRHLIRVLGEDFDVRGLTLVDLQRYVNTRSTQKWRRGQTIKPDTIRKELGTLSSVWTAQAKRGRVSGPFPGEGLRFAKGRQKERFQTAEEIERQIKRRGLDELQAADLWDSLYLRLGEIDEVLAHVRDHGSEKWVYPMFVMAARTGARRSEILRSQPEDFDFHGKTVTLREKKKDKDKMTFRVVPLHPSLAEAMKAWLKDYPGGGFTVCREANRPIPAHLAQTAFHDSLAGSEKWAGRLRGWHVFRHSFASNCALKRVDQRMIDRWLGHQTTQMRQRYQHLFPEDQQLELAKVFG